MGNILGSNISNTLLILGLTGVVSPLIISSTRLKKESAFYLITCLILMSFIYFSSTSTLFRFHGFILITLFICSLFIFFNTSTQQESTASSHDTFSTFKMLSFFILGCMLLPLGGNLLVDSAITIAISFGISKAFISLFAVALGTSLPELITSVVAARKGTCDIALGNIVGSNIFNLTLVLGISSLIHPITFDILFNQDIFIMLLSTIPLIFVLFFTQLNSLSRKYSVLSLLFYSAYMIYIFYR